MSKKFESICIDAVKKALRIILVISRKCLFKKLLIPAEFYKTTVLWTSNGKKSYIVSHTAQSCDADNLDTRCSTYTCNRCCSIHIPAARQCHLTTCIPTAEIEAMQFNVIMSCTSDFTDTLTFKKIIVTLPRLWKVETIANKIAINVAGNRLSIKLPRVINILFPRNVLRKAPLTIWLNKVILIFTTKK